MIQDLSYWMLFYILIKELRMTFKDFEFKKAYNNTFKAYYLSDEYCSLNLDYQLNELYGHETDAENSWNF